MGAIPRTFCRPALRSVLLALLGALAWLVWGAGTATASSLVPDAGDLVKPSSSAFATPLPLPVPPVSVSSGDAAMTAAAALTQAAAGRINTLTAPALPLVSGTVDTVTGLVPGLPEPPLVQAPLPLPLTDVLPLPEQLPPLLPEPLPAPLPLPEPLPDLLPVPGSMPLPNLPPLTTPAPGPVPNAAPGLPASDGSNLAISGSPAASVTSAFAEPAGATAGPGTLTFGFTPAQDRAGFASPPGAKASPSGTEGGAEHPGRLDLPAVTNGAGTTNTGSAGFEGAAEPSGSWPALPAVTSEPNLSGAEALPAGPSFDPGSSPD